MKPKNQLRILLTCDPEIPVPPGQYGGIERIVDLLVTGLVNRGHDVILCANNASSVSCKLVAWKGQKSQHFPDIIKNTVTLTKTVLQHKVDLVHSFSRLAYMGLIMPSRIPKIMSYQREPSVAQVKKAVRLSAKNSLWFTGCSNYITNQIKPFSTAWTIYNAAPFDRFALAEMVSADAPLVFLGRIEEIKGTYEAILVAKKTGRRLLIAGNIPGGKEAYFNEKVRPYLDEHIRYIGPVDDQQKNDLMRSAAALLMPIQWNEPFGIVMAEAMACGTPVVGLARGAVPEVVSDGVTGFVCGNTDEMVLAVSKVCLINRTRVRQYAWSRFSEHAMVDSYLNLYEQIQPKEFYE